ncbi:MAG: polyamine ABC transporter permease [SAR324 cluster bacterium]|uniref:Polyamine ABC transporter permease n=1 Tax=SAR324 cluster bacterium TaxID=2024889 RepID=A0A2A4T3P6_9DELT|nr:MAG: polyamine ABC transporter permease [SAR324 cluster bacterium]
MNFIWRWFFRLFCLAVFIYLIFPILVIIPMSFSSASFLTFPPPGYSLRWYEQFLNDQDWLDAAKNSISIAVVTTILATTLGVLASMGLVRGNFRGKAILTAFIVSPMVAPLIIAAAGMYFIYSKLSMVETFMGMVLAHTVLATPFVVVTISATLQSFDRSLENAAASLGANPVTTFFKVTLPIITPGIVSGALFAFVTSFDEVVIALFISGIEYRTLPVKMFEGIRFEINPTITVVATFLIVLSTGFLALMEYLRRRGEAMRGVKS